MDIEAKRAKGRKQYAHVYPHGFPRRRNGAQVRKQLAAQANYERSEPIALIRKLQKLPRLLLQGPHKAAEKLLGCTHRQLVAHLSCSEPFFIAYRKHPREFNLHRMQDKLAAFHYTNLYARPKTITANSQRAKTFLCPSPLALLPKASLHEAPSAQE